MLLRSSYKKVLSGFLFFISFFIFSLSCDSTKSLIITPSLVDSTSHNFAWEIDTLGTFQSRLHSAWGTSSENIWAVGLIYLDTIIGSNIAHWNGKEWTYQNILQGNLFSITGYSADNIWSVGEWYGASTSSGTGSYIVHWNGQVWNVNKLNFEGLRAVWGKSTNNLFAVGHYGTILRYNGSSWSKMESGTALHLKDIWGSSENDVYAVGGDDSQGIGILLHFNGSIWSKIYERTYVPNIPSGYASTIWGVKDEYYLNSGSGQYKGKDTSWSFVNAPTDNTYLETIRGNSVNNLFFIGHFGLLVHWNGKSWYRYDEFFRKPDGDLLLGAWVEEKNIVIVGRSDNAARGIVYRGKMIY
jgi:hypothetical protein